jgi:hypothetical protein
VKSQFFVLALALTLTYNAHGSSIDHSATRHLDDRVQKRYEEISASKPPTPTLSEQRTQEAQREQQRRMERELYRRRK